MTVGPGTILYFAYGSNLCVPRLKARTPGAELMGRATLPGYALRWHKRSVDGSGKCDVVSSDVAESEVHGAVFAIPVVEMALLDEAEGLGNGYDRMTVNVEAFGRELTASTYTATRTHIDPDLRPYSW